MDGGQLLAAVRLRHPGTARLVLSGYAERSAIVSAIAPIQQFLSKPCELDTLLAALTRVLEVRDLLVAEPLRRTLGDIDSLPKPAAGAGEMIAVTSRPDATLPEVVAVIESDLGLSTEILRLVNSSFFGPPAKVDSVGHAATLLGLETIRDLALGGTAFGPGTPVPASLDGARISRVGLAAGRYARTIARREEWPPDLVSHAFLAGLLYDLGFLVLATHCPDRYATLRRTPTDDPAGLDAASLAAFGCTGPTATAYLLGLWGFAEPVIRVMAAGSGAPADPSPFPLARVVGLARAQALADQA